MNKTNNSYFKIICEEVTPFKKVIHEDRNFGTFEEVNAFVASKLHKYPNAKWELYERGENTRHFSGEMNRQKCRICT